MYPHTVIIGNNMSYYVVKNLSENILKELYNEHFKENCPDCNASIGEEHDENCDVAECDTCGGQRLSCDCKEENHAKWTGYWPGIDYCYKNKLVVYDTASKTIMFDLNTAVMQKMEKKWEEK